MRKYAFLLNNSIVQIATLSEEDFIQQVKLYEGGVDIEDISPQPQVGWALVGNALSPLSALPIEQIIQAKIKKAREFGSNLIGDATDRIGAKNVLSGKTEAQILEIAGILLPIKQILEGGALATARTQLLAVRPLLDAALQTEIDYTVAQIAGYLGY